MVTEEFNNQDPEYSPHLQIWIISISRCMEKLQNSVKTLIRPLGREGFGYRRLCPHVVLALSHFTFSEVLGQLFLDRPSPGWDYFQPVGVLLFVRWAVVQI